MSTFEGPVTGDFLIPEPVLTGYACADAQIEEAEKRQGIGYYGLLVVVVEPDVNGLPEPHMARQVERFTSHYDSRPFEIL